MAKDKNGSDPYENMQKLGLSRTCVLCYKSLFENGHSSVVQLHAQLKQPKSSIYHALKQLEQQGFITSIKAIGPRYYSAIRLDTALENLAIHQRSTVRKITELQIEKTIQQRSRQHPRQP